MARWYDLSPDEAIGALGSDRYAGLSSAEARRRLGETGTNLIFPIPKGNFFSYIRQISLNPLTVLLLLTAVLTAFFSDPAVSLAILLLLGVGYGSVIFVYVKAQKIFAGMSKFSLPYAKVIRDGRLFILRQSQLVPGDIILLSAGDIVPADARLIEDDDLYLLEAGITEAKGAIRKNANYLDYRNLAPHQQVNMVFASTIVARGRGRAVVCCTGDRTLVVSTHKNRPAVRYDQLTLFDRLQKLSYIASIASIAVVFALTLLNFATHRWEVLSGFVTLLALSVAALSEFYTAFARILVAAGIFSAVRQRGKVTKGALIKNADKLAALAGVTTLILPPEALVAEQDLWLSALSVGGAFHPFDPKDKDRDLAETTLLRYGVISTGIYGADQLIALSDAGENTFTFEEDAILKAGSQSGIWSRELDEHYRLADHRRREDAPEGAPPCDLTITFHSGQYVLIARGDVRQILALCSHYADEAGRPRPLSTVRRRQILTDAGQRMRGGQLITAIAASAIGTGQIKDIGDLTGQMTFEGMLCFEEPMLPGCAMTLQKLRDAGLRIILLTPEESERSYYLAEALGIVDDRAQAVSAAKIRQMGDDLFLANFTGYTLYQGLTGPMRRTLMKLWQEKGERVLYMGRELSEIHLIREADVGATQALTLSGKGLRKLSSPSGAKIPVHFSQSADGALNGCDALRFVSDVVVSMVDREGTGGLNAISDAILAARRVFRNLHRMLTYLTVSVTARLLLSLIGFAFGFLFLTPVQILFWGLLLDLSAILTLALSTSGTSLTRRSARSGKDYGQIYPPALLRLSLFGGCALALILALIAPLSLLIGLAGAEISALVFLSLPLAMPALLLETGRRTRHRVETLTLSRSLLITFGLIFAFLLLCFLIPPLGAPFGLSALSPAALPLALLPAAATLALGEILHRLFGDVE